MRYTEVLMIIISAADRDNKGEACGQVPLAFLYTTYKRESCVAIGAESKMAS